MARTDMSIRRTGGYLIGDSAKDGRDQVISPCFMFPHPEHNAFNQRVLDEATAYARQNGYTNIRCEVITYVARTIPQGIIGWKEIRRRTTPLTEKVKKIFIV